MATARFVWPEGVASRGPLAVALVSVLLRRNGIMQRRSSRLANSRHRVVRFEEHGDAGGGGGARGGGASSSGAGRGAGSDSGRGASAEKCNPGRLSVGSTAVSGERFRFAVGELVAGLPCTAEVERVDAARFSGNYVSSIKLYALFSCMDCASRCKCGLNLHLLALWVLSHCYLLIVADVSTASLVSQQDAG